MKVLEKRTFGIEKLCTGRGNGNGGCTSKLLIETNDIYLTYHTDLSGETDFFYTFKCPVCGVETDIPDKEVPYSIRSALLDEYKARRLRRVNEIRG